ncbi:MAG: PAS domain S-box protein [Planctomycetes bacterium]|nr:PAS domain S-box protein [Planctomycetota bacterium]
MLQRKISFGFLKRGHMAILILIVAMGMGALIETKELAQLTEQLYQHAFKASNNLLEANGRIEEMRALMGEVVLARSDQELDALGDRLDLLEATTNEHFRGVAEAFLGDKTDLLNAHQRFQDWKPLRTQIIRLVRAGRYDEALVLNQGKNGDAVDQLANEMRGLIDFARAEAENFMHDSKERQYQSRIFLLSSLVAVVLLTVIISVGTAKRDRESRRELLESESRYRELYEKTPVMLHSADKQGRLIDVSDYWLKNLGYSRDNVIGRPMTTFLSEESRRLVEEAAEPRFQETGEVKDLELEFVRSDGEIRIICLSALAKYAADGSFLCSQSVLEDITERRRAEEQVRKLSNAVEQSPAAVVITDTEGVIEYVNPAFTAATGYEKKEMIGQKTSVLRSDEMPDETYEDIWKTVRAGNPWSGVVVHRKRNGTTFLNEITMSPIVDPRGVITNFVGIGQDITERLKAEQALEESEHRLSVAIDNMAVGIVVIDENGTITEFNPFAERIFGYEAPEVVGKSIEMLMPERYRNERDKCLRTGLDTGTGKIKGIGREVTGLRKNGETFPMRFRVGELKTAEGSLFVGTVYDLTEIKQLESQLRHSQKMDAIGHLTGGIAHDFNNILGIVMGNLELLQSQVAGNAKALKSVNSALKGAERGASLTKKLLGFSRQSAAEVKFTNINEFIESLHGLIAKSLTPSIRVEQRLADDLWPVEIDPGDFEDVPSISTVNVFSNKTRRACSTCVLGLYNNAIAYLHTSGLSDFDNFSGSFVPESRSFASTFQSFIFRTHGRGMHLDKNKILLRDWVRFLYKPPCHIPKHGCNFHLCFLL